MSRDDIPPGTVVARLRQPMPIVGHNLTHIVRGLEQTYGKGLVIVPESDEWLAVAIPKASD